MIVTLRDGLKAAGVMLILACAAFVCTLFLGYRIDLTAMEPELEAGLMRTLYDAQVAASNVILAVTGGCLIATSAVVVCFYVAVYVERRQQQLGVLKALGYSEWELARQFWVFGLSGLAGGAAGFLAAWCYLPVFSETMNSDGLLPDLALQVHAELLVPVAVLPALLMAAVAVLAARRELRRPALSLLRGADPASVRQLDARDISFLAALRKSIRSTRKAILFFIFIGGFCYGTMMQMAPSMRELSSDAMGLMMFVIGLVLAVTATTLAASSAVRARQRTLALMHAVGYTQRERRSGVLGVYRPFAYIGFAVGTLYQYFLLRLMVDVFYADYPDMPAYSFDVPVFSWVLATFAVFYELCMTVCASQMRRMTLRELMAE